MATGDGRFHVTIEELVAYFLVWGETHDVKHGKLTKNWAGMKAAAAPLQRQG